MSIDKLIETIEIKRKQNLEAKIQRYPRKNLIASDIQDCDRYLYYSVVNWQDKPIHDASLQALFDSGNQIERNVMRDLIDLGFNVIQSQMPFEIKDNLGNKICTGKVDGKIVFEGVVYPFEIKSMDGNLFNGIKSIEDLNKKPYQRKYLKQLMLYLFGHNHENGFFIIDNCRGQWKLLPMALDYGLCEAILQRLERSHKAILANKEPECIEYNSQLCDKCSFAHICLQDNIKDPANFIDNVELETSLERREELKPLAKEYEELDEVVKNTFRGVPEAFVGKSWRITSMKYNKTSIDKDALPADIAKQYTKITECWKTKVTKI
jgi:hypothetical protein